MVDYKKRLSVINSTKAKRFFPGLNSSKTDKKIGHKEARRIALQL